jgi:DNA invertase Pin-like site-specific DNA recombinase
MPKTYIIYTRCSTEEQRKKGNSHEYQIREIEAFGNRRGMKCLGIFSDTMTGTTFLGRSELDKAYKMCENMRGNIDYLISYKMDRFGRDVAEAIHSLKKFRSIGVEVNFSDEWMEYEDSSHPIVLAVKFGMAEAESLRISERTKDGIYQSQLNGLYPFSAPFGYIKTVIGTQKANGTHLKICVPDPDKISMIKKCFEMVANGSTQMEAFRKYGRQLQTSRTNFFRMLRNPFYTGTIEVKAFKENPPKTVKGKHEKIIDRDLFDRCQVALQTDGTNRGSTWQIHNPNGDSDFYLKGILKCDRTDKKMTAFTIKKKSGKRYPYYATPSGKNRRQIKAAQAHNLVSKALHDLEISNDLYDILKEELQAEASQRTQDVTLEMAKIEKLLTKEKDRLNRVTMDYADGQIDAGTFNKLRDNFVNSIADLEMQLIDYQEQMSRSEEVMFKLMGLLKNLPSMFDQYGIKQKNHFLRAAFPEGFYIDPECKNLLTRETNLIFDIMGCKPESYETIKIKRDLGMPENPALGGRRQRLQTHLNLFLIHFNAA